MKIRNVLIPAIAIVVMAAILLGAGYLTSDLRARKIQEEHVYMMKTLLPDSESFVREAYSGEDEAVKSVHKAENGYVVETAVQGYAGEIIMMVGVANDGSVTGLVVRDMNETFGLGANALTDHEFLSQFLQTSGEAEVGVNVDAITGATVTSKAVTRAVNSAVAVVTGVDAATSATTWGG